MLNCDNSNNSTKNLKITFHTLSFKNNDCHWLKSNLIIDSVEFDLNAAKH